MAGCWRRESWELLMFGTGANAPGILHSVEFELAARRQDAAQRGSRGPAKANPAAALAVCRFSTMVATTEQDVEVANEMSQSAKFVFDTAG